MDGDGFADVLVGNPWDDWGAVDTGSVDLFFGTPSGLSTSAVVSVGGGVAGANLGAVVAPAGDVDGDGFSEFLVGAPGIDLEWQPDLGRLALHRGAPGHAAFPAMGWATYGAQNHERWPSSAALAGDVDADGDPDVIVGSSRFVGSGAESGRARLFLGNGPGTTIHPAQRDLAGTRVDAGAGARVPSGFQVSALARSPLGPTRARLEIEVKEIGRLIDGTDLRVGESERDTGTAGIELGETIAVTDAPPRQSWRVRARFSRSAHPLQPHGRWATLGDAGLTTSKLGVYAACVDGDDDGYGTAPTPLCAAFTMLADCDDSDRRVFPGAYNSCDGVNNNCSDPAWPAVQPSELDTDGDGYWQCNGDCDDTDPTTYSVAPQLCDGKDNDCGWNWSPNTPANEVDADLDGVRVCAGDCDEGDALVWALPGMIDDLAFAADRVTLTWTAPSSGTSRPLQFDTLRSERPADFLAFGVCIESNDASDTTSTDLQRPFPGQVLFYLARAENACGGSIGDNSDGTPRSGRACP